MARLPEPGGDAGNWGAILNDYLIQAHDAGGMIKSASVGSTQLQSNAVTKTKLSAAVQASVDKADTALQTAPVTSVAAKTGAVNLVKADVGLANVDNTADLQKPLSTATQDALADKYTIPVAGIPETDLANAVQTKLNEPGPPGDPGPGIAKGTYASRAAITDPAVGLCYIQTDGGGGNLAGTLSRYNGSAWEVVTTAPQNASSGMQGATWITPMNTWGTTPPTSQSLTWNNEQAYLFSFRPEKTITIASVGAFMLNTNTSHRFDLGIYRYNGSVVERLTSLGGANTFPATPAFARHALPQSIELTRGITYAFALSTDAPELLVNGWAGSDEWASFITWMPDELPAWQHTLPSFPLPATMELSYLTGAPLSKYAMIAGSSTL